jgi:hypothetical protein
MASGYFALAPLEVVGSNPALPEGCSCNNNKLPALKPSVLKNVLDMSCLLLKIFLPDPNIILGLVFGRQVN